MAKKRFFFGTLAMVPTLIFWLVLAGCKTEDDGGSTTSYRKVRVGLRNYSTTAVEFKIEPSTTNPGKTISKTVTKEVEAATDRNYGSGTVEIDIETGLSGYAYAKVSAGGVTEDLRITRIGATTPTSDVYFNQDRTLSSVLQ